MQCENNTTRLRREILIRIAEALYAGNLETTVERIPLEMRPRNEEAVRCCIYKDRAVIRYRCMAAMGFAAEDEADEARPLADYAREAQTRAAVDGPVLTVLDIACSGCIRSRYWTTEACRGCLARPCMVNCPRDAITIEKGRSRIDPEKCINCGKCQQVCPYGAIIRVPIPCEEACPVGAIDKDATGREKIDFEKCISCGRCMRACPFGAIMEKSQMVDVVSAIRQKKRVVAMVAPAIIGQFPGDLEQIADALRQLGFDAVVEVALGAEATALHEAEEFRERMEEGQPFMTTSCCPGYVEAVKRHMPRMAAYVSDTPSPMHYTAALVKKDDPDAVTVFIGPCVAKRKEGQDNPLVDYVMTFEELGALLVAQDIEVAICEGVPVDTPAAAEARGFAVSGGVTAAIRAVVGEDAVRPVVVDGLNRDALKHLCACAERGTCDGNFIEVMACEGGCVGGAGVVGNARATGRDVRTFAAESAPLCVPPEHALHAE